jgi:tripartite-type tricarboxylate transporter receptor subunit TctC
MKRRTLLTATAAATSALIMPAALAQTGPYPNRPIRLIVPFAPGVSPDVLARLIGDRLSNAMGQPVVIENRPGAGGMIAALAAAAAAADGYTLFYSVKASHAIAPNVYKDSKYNPPRDFKAVSQVLLVPHVLTATPKAPYNTMKELVDYAKKNPGKIDFASLGVGSQPHVAMESWSQRLGIKLNHVPYKTNPSPDVMSGVVSLSLEASTTAIPLIKSGKVKALGISGAQRIPNLPDVPTMTEFDANLDVNGVIGSAWQGIFTPTGTPNEVIAKLNTEIVKIVKMPDIQARMLDLGLTPTGTTAAALDAVANSDYAFWNKVVDELNIKVE